MKRGFQIQHYCLPVHKHGFTFLLAIILLSSSCGTGPWIVKKNLYTVYKKPIYENNANSHLRNDGLYILREHLINDTKSKSFLKFQTHGYTVSGAIVKNKNLNTEQNFTPEDSQFFVHGHHWFKVSSDSIIIEFCGANKNMMQTWVFHKRGLIESDGSLGLSFEDLPKKIYRYDFVEMDSLPSFKNQESYKRKKWYLKNIHPSRKIENKKIMNNKLLDS